MNLYNYFNLPVSLLNWTWQKLLKKMTANTVDVFDTCDHYWTCHKAWILYLCSPPGGAAIFFFQTWNFELKFFVDDPFMQKIISIGVGSHFFPKKYLEGPKTQIQKLYWCLEKDWKWPSKSIESTINCLHNVWMPQCSFGLSNFRFLVSNVQYLDCNLLAVLAHFWTKNSFSHL